MTGYVLSFHLGPVQPFIAAARRTRDIWAGSFLLSWLSARALAAALGGGELERVKSPFGVQRDPMFRAVLKHQLPKLSPESVAAGDAWTRAVLAHDGEPFLGSFPHQFKLAVSEKDGLKAADRAEQAVRTAWIALGAAVETLIFETEVGGTTLAEDYPEARTLFRRQIVHEGLCPLWEIYTVVTADHWEDVHGGVSPLALRKFTRWSPDCRALPQEQRGGLCSMLAGWREISAVEHTTTADDDVKRRRRDFWNRLRTVIVAARYKEAARGRAWECLDIRANEQLCAPALVKRLFPLLDEAVLREVIGWEPSVLNWSPPALPPGAAPPSRFDQFRSFIARLVGAPRAEIVPSAQTVVEPAPVAPTTPTRNPMTRNPVLWPSTSYMAAAHWLERAQRAAPAAAEELAAAVGAAGRHLRYAERSLFVKCTNDEHRTSLAEVDGACFFETSLVRMIKDAKDDTADKAAERTVAALEKARQGLLALYRRPLDADDPNGPAIGAPAPVYAVVRADGDRIGELLANEGPDRKLSAQLAAFVRALRGDEDVGVIAENNGVTLYAAADEMIALCPVEDALDLAVAVKDTFVRLTDGTPATLSAAITFAHRQVPLSWVLESGHKLLAGVAKERMGRSALAIELLDAGGRQFDWAAHWDSPDDPIGCLRELVRAGTGEAMPIGTNQFMHDLSDVLAPLLTADTGPAGAELRGPGGFPGEFRLDLASVAETAKVVLRYMIGEACQEKLKSGELDGERLDRLAECLLFICCTYERGPQPKRMALRKDVLSSKGLRLLRFLVENWRYPSAVRAAA